MELTEVNPSYAYVRYPDGRECTVSLQDLAPCPEPNGQFEPRDEAATAIVDRPEEIPADTQHQAHPLPYWLNHITSYFQV